MGVNLSGQIPDDPGSNNVFGRLGSEAGGLGQAIGGAFNGMMDGIGNAIRGVFDPSGAFAPIGAAAKEITDGQSDLQDRVDLISTLLDYGSSYIPENSKASGTRILPFTQQLGPMRGVRIKGNGIEFLAAGLWDIRVIVTNGFTISISGNEVVVSVMVKKPNGETYSVQKHKTRSLDTTSSTVITSVLVPEPGYYVEVHNQVIVGRGVLGGPAWSRLTVQRVASKITGNWGTGAEGSDQEPSREEEE